MVNHRAGTTLVQGHVEGIQHPLRTQMGRHGPAHHPAAPSIHHHTQIQKTRSRGKVGEVGNPQFIRTGGRKHPVDQAVAFARISRSIRSCLFSRRRRRSSSCSGRLGPSRRTPSSRSACITQLRTVWPEGSNSWASESGLRPVRTNSPSVAGTPAYTDHVISAWLDILLSFFKK